MAFEPKWTDDELVVTDKDGDRLEIGESETRDGTLIFGLSGGVTYVTPDDMRQLLPYFQRFADSGRLFPPEPAKNSCGISDEVPFDAASDKPDVEDDIRDRMDELELSIEECEAAVNDYKSRQDVYAMAFSHIRARLADIEHRIGIRTLRHRTNPFQNGEVAEALDRAVKMTSA